MIHGTFSTAHGAFSGLTRDDIAQLNSMYDGRVFAFGHEGDRELAAKSQAMIAVPAAGDLLSPMLMAIPLQLLSYHVAVRLGRDVDQPRNLAKSVTVE